ncbi:response regulator [Fulvivirga lutea]|uniref:Response regulator transcription factor n=1 Tax=Fulvivirga lutea TaxID=2810512 RepID=A0A975A0N0_9BACT|nr:response regulator transcription factor [Fulvivirga lutea]QSE97431.1 response regulator transcription factor [Fulvivirga lutea]
MTYSIFIIDDHKIVRDGLKAILLGYPEYEVAGEAASGEEAKRKIENLNPDIVFVDLRLPDANGALLIQELIRLKPQSKFILLTAEPNALDLQRAQHAGASGFLGKDINSDEYIRAMAAVMAGKKYISQSFSHLLVEDASDLSIRELEILQLLADGLPYKQIADKLSISPRTVETHKNNLLKKLDVGTPIELVKKALKTGLIKG